MLITLKSAHKAHSMSFHRGMINNFILCMFNCVTQPSSFHQLSSSIFPCFSSLGPKTHKTLTFCDMGIPKLGGSDHLGKFVSDKKSRSRYQSKFWFRHTVRMAPFAFVTNLVTRWRNLNQSQIWSPDGTCCISCKVQFAYSDHENT